MTLHTTIRPALATVNCFVLATLAWGTVFYGHSVYMDALMREHGWSSSFISSAILVFWLSSLPGTLSVGILVDRYGPAPVVAIGGLCIGGGLALLGTINEPWQLFPIYAAMGFGYPALAAAAISATLAPWFERGFGLALGIALTGASVGGALLPALIVNETASQGFGPTMLTIGTAVLAFSGGIVVALLLIGRRSSVTKTTGTSPPAQYSMFAIVKRARFWIVAVPAALGLGGQVGLLAHQVPMIATQTDQVTAALMVTVVAVASAFGRILVGVLSRYLSLGVLTSATYLCHGAGIAMLAVAGTDFSIFVACAVAGLTVGPIVLLPPIIVRQIFGIDGFGRTYAMTNVVMYILAGISPWLVGLLKDATGAYTAGLWSLVGMEIVAAVLILGALGFRNAKQPIAR